MHGTESPSPWIARWAHLIAPHSTVLDLACGAGRHMRYLRAQGHRLLGIDRSPQALDNARAWGDTLQADVEQGAWPLPDQQFGAVVVTHYLWRPLWPQITSSLAVGGVLLYETFAQGQETVGRPARADFLLAPGELLQVAVHAGLRVVAYEDGFLTEPARFIQRMAAVRAPSNGQPMRCALTSEYTPDTCGDGHARDPR